MEHVEIGIIISVLGVICAVPLWGPYLIDFIRRVEFK